MKTKILPALVAGLLALSASADQTPRTFTAHDGQFPWYDCIKIYSLDALPASVQGSEPVPQQECGSRALRIPPASTSITIGAQGRDMAALREAYPGLQPTGETFSIVSKDGGSTPYQVATLANPPVNITGPFQAGLVLLKVVSAAPGTSTTAAPPSAASKRMPLAFEPGEKSKLHIYVLMGQSNMLGRDTTGLISQTVNPRIGFLGDNSRWYAALEPMYRGSGFGPGTFFATEMLKSMPDGNIGLVPCAVGGTPLSRWVKGADLYENAVKRTKEAMAFGELDGMLWHQGESDSSKPEDAGTYETRLVQMLKDFRQDVGMPDLPIVVGELGPFVKAPQVQVVEAAIRRVPNDLPQVGFADSVGLGHRGDNLHFSTAAQQEFGKRYAEAMRKLQQASPMK